MRSSTVKTLALSSSSKVHMLTTIALDTALQETMFFMSFFKWSRDRVKLIDLHNSYVHLPMQTDSLSFQVHPLPRSRSRSPVHHSAAAAANRAFKEEVKLPADPFDMGLA